MKSRGISWPLRLEPESAERNPLITGVVPTDTDSTDFGFYLQYSPRIDFQGAGPTTPTLTLIVDR
jgi:hypothetical protein